MISKTTHRARRNGRGIDHSGASWLRRLLRGATVAAACLPSLLLGAEVDFSRDVRPILSQYCLKCHGPDDAKREAGLRLDVRENATKELDSGNRAIVPGKPAESALLDRIASSDENEVMPPISEKKRLSREQQQILRDWIDSGAEYQAHWSFVAPKQTEPPAVQRAAWPRNAIDRFVLARHEQLGLSPSPEADRHALARRVYLDLIGLPPTGEELSTFVNDQSPDAYERLVDRLLASPHYGERWARRWLDLARYADTNGYEKDRPRSIWPYRDWVISALNADMPFDRFTIEQLAGDMLPQATPRQLVATGFHRNTMLNEEGGADPQEFRYHAVVDRVTTTGTTWLGLTLQCAQCHTHKYDPITHAEYFRFFALLNNADEESVDLPDDKIAHARREIEAKIAADTASLAESFPLPEEYRWQTPRLVQAIAQSGAKLERLDDGSLLASGMNPDKDTYTLELETDDPQVTALRLEALTHDSLGNKGPGRTPHGNFVLTEIRVAAIDAAGTETELRLEQPSADVEQAGFPVAHAIDGHAATGWAIHGEGKWNADRTATFQIVPPERSAKATRWRITLDQNYGGQHTLGRFRISLGAKRAADDRPAEVRRREYVDAKFREWLAAESSRAVKWTPLRPTKATANLPSLTILDDGSVLASGDQSKRDTYEVDYATDVQDITAIRLEALADERLTGGGPGRVYYEGQLGDFFLAKFELFAARHGRAAVSGNPLLETYDPLAIPFTGAVQDFASGKNGAAGALDGDDESVWSVTGQTGKSHFAAFTLAEPLRHDGTLKIRITCAYYHAADVGRFRILATTAPLPEHYVPRPAQIEALLLVPSHERTDQQLDALMRYYLSVAPELESRRKEIDEQREKLPRYPTTLVMHERAAEFTRRTHRHERGEFVQPKEQVAPGVFAALLPGGVEAPTNRLELARWLVDPNNPLTARVTVNRQWAAFFGRGIVRTTEDFGYQGAPPSHPELLDWLSVEFVKQGWSLKQLHRQIVTSATYRQSSRLTSELRERDPENVWLARGPRQRIEAELVRDVLLAASGLLSHKVGGPSVFPPQPPGVSTEGAYGPLAWNVSEGEDRYRRGLYTFSKRTAPYAMFATFDAPSGEACVARRDVSNTPLQSLTLLNDSVATEAAQALGKYVVDSRVAIQAWAGERGLECSAEEAAAAYLVERCLSRPSPPEERALLARFAAAQLDRCQRKELDAAAIAGAGDGDAAQRAAWTLTARVLFNLDEFVVKR